VALNKQQINWKEVKKINENLEMNITLKMSADCPIKIAPESPSRERKKR